MAEHNPLDLAGQVAFVTGAGQGAGRAIALTLARHNAGGVAVNDFVPERAAAVASEIEALGVPAKSSVPPPAVEPVDAAPAGELVADIPPLQAPPGVPAPPRWARC